MLTKCSPTSLIDLIPLIATVSKTTERISYVRINKPWLTSELMRLIKLKLNSDKLFRDEGIFKHINTQMRNKVNIKIKESKENFMQNLITLY